MNETNFKICCPSCETVFEVTDPSLIGQIVACPKCGGMILIEEPADQEFEQHENVSEPANEQVEQNRNEVVDESAIIERGGANVASAVPPVCEPRDEEPVEEDGTNNVWRTRLILIVAGVVCALLVMGVWRFLVGPQHKQPGGPVDNEVAVEEKDNTDDEPQIADVDNEPEEDETDLVLIRDDSASDNEEFDVDAAVTFDDEEEQVAPEVDDEPTSVDDEVNADAVEESVSTDEDVVDDETEELEDDGEVIELADDSTSLSVEDDIEASEEEDDDSLDNDAVPIEFDEERFEKVNKSAEPEEEDEEVDMGAVASTAESEIQRSFPQLKQASKEIDVDARLALKIKEIEFPESPADSVRLLSELSGVPVEFDLTSFELIAPSMAVTLHLSLQDTNVGDAIKALAELLKWKTSVEKDRIKIEPLDDLSEVVEERFDIADLLNADFGKAPICLDEGADEENDKTWLERFVITMVDPEAWGSDEGQGSLVLNGTELLVKHNALERKRVSDLLERLRALHGVEAKNDVSSNTLIAETLGWERLTKKISFNLLNSTPLQQAIEILERTQKIKVIWDDAALNEFGVGRDFTTVARINDVPIDQVLFDLLEPAKLTYLILAENLFLITTKERAENYKTIEIHQFSVAEKALSEEACAKLVDEMKQAVAPKSWGDPDVTLWCDVASGCWFVRQTQPVQRSIRRWLDERR